MPSWLFIVVIVCVLVGIGILIDYFYKKKEVTIDTKRLSEETKDNMGNSSSLM